MLGSLRDRLLDEPPDRREAGEVSLDELVRRLFKAAALGVAAIKKVVWVNPVNSAEQPLVWLRSGAKAENVRMLGYVEPES